jgi:hypothetical protein
MYFEFYLDDIEIEEPQGFADIILNVKRDDIWHGIFFEASTSDLGFYGVAYDYLKNKRETLGLKADVTFKALQACGIYDEPEIIFEGKLDFGKYSRNCGTSCLIRMPVEKTGCLMTLRNRYDQKVDIDNPVALDKISPLQNYDQLGQTMPMPAVAIDARVEGYSVDDGLRPLGPSGWAITCSLPAGGEDVFIVRPEYEDERFNSIATGQLTGVNACNYPSPITPQLLYDSELNKKCFNEDFQLDARLKGELFAIPSLTGTLKEVQANVLLWNGVGDIQFNSINLSQQIILASPGVPMPTGNIPFDASFSLVVNNQQINDNTGLYVVLTYVTDSTTDGLPGREVIVGAIFHPDTFFKVSTNKICPDTTVQYYMIHETLSRITESITSNCLKVKSEYYGRTDSEPYASAEDGCGSLRIVTSGLKIRRADNPAFFSSLKDIFDGLRGIDNIGLGIESNPFIPGYDWVRIEPVEYFYQDIEILSLPFVPEASEDIQEQLHYGVIKSGYQKWEVETINGLQEPHSNREYRTGLSSVSNPIDITSKLVAGSYPIEITRQQSFADTGAADTTYDNETFIICVERQGYGFIVERNNIDNAANIFSPSTLYNWRIRPFSNLMRWFKSIANSYVNLSDSSSKLFFSAGTGNFIAEGELVGSTCKLENGVKAENRDLSQVDFTDANEATPLWKPEYIIFKYPLSVADYKTIKSNPYGYISYQCGNGAWKKGFVQEIRYQINKGIADITLKSKWE